MVQGVAKLPVLWLEGGREMFVLLFIYKFFVPILYICDMYDTFHNKFLEQPINTC